MIGGFYMRIAIYGTGSCASKFLDELGKIPELDIQISYFVESEGGRTKEEFVGKKVISVENLETADFDYLVIASKVYYNEIITNIKKMFHESRAINEKIVFYTDFLDLCMKRESYNVIVKTEEGIEYVCDHTDRIIRRVMQDTKRTYSAEDIHKFFELTDTYYGNQKRSGYFLDIGANIGTTSIYVKKQINPDLSIVAFEPSKENYKRFRINCILNDVEDIEIVPAGLGSEETEKVFCYHSSNPGASNVLQSEELIKQLEGSSSIETVKTMRLDKYLESKEINAEEIDYIWIDVEGFESEVIEGAMDLLCKRKIPLVQEFNPSSYKNLENYIQNMQSAYDNFIVLEFEEEKIYSTKELAAYVEYMEVSGMKSCNLFFF